MAAYPGGIKYINCPLCGKKVKLVCKQDFRHHGTCPSCGKAIIDD